MKPLLLLVFFSLASAQAKTLQDPTKPSPNTSILSTGQDPSATLPMALTLTAIIHNNQNKHAIINGKIFAEGQQVQDYTVIFISQNHVLLAGSDGQQTLYVNNSNIKKDANNGF